MSKKRKVVVDRVETLIGSDYTHAVYYKDGSGCPIKFVCHAVDELDAYQQARHNIMKESNNVIQSHRV